RSVEISSGGQVHHCVRAPALGPLKFLNFFVGARGNRRSAHVCVDLCLAGSTDRHRIQAMLKMHLVRRNDQTSGSNFITYLFSRQMRFALSNTTHLWSDHTETRMLKLSHRRKAFWCSGESALSYPTFGQEVPRRF